MREIHIQLTLGASFPGEPLAVRSKLIEAIEDEVGEVGDTGTGGGVMDIWMTVAKAREAARRIRRITKRLGIAEWTEVTIRSERVVYEILADNEFSIERAQEAAEALVHAIRSDAERWAEVQGYGIGGGMVALDIDVRDPASAEARLDAIARQLGIADRTRLAED